MPTNQPTKHGSSANNGQNDYKNNKAAEIASAILKDEKLQTKARLIEIIIAFL